MTEDNPATLLDSLQASTERLRESINRVVEANDRLGEILNAPLPTRPTINKRTISAYNRIKLWFKGRG